MGAEHSNSTMAERVVRKQSPSPDGGDAGGLPAAAAVVQSNRRPTARRIHGSEASGAPCSTNITTTTTTTSTFSPAAHELALLMADAASKQNNDSGISTPTPEPDHCSATIPTATSTPLHEVGTKSRDSQNQSRKRARLFQQTDLRSVWYLPNDPDQEVTKSTTAAAAAAATTTTTATNNTTTPSNSSSNSTAASAAARLLPPPPIPSFASLTHNRLVQVPKVVKLTHKLVDTYKKINVQYYATKEKGKEKEKEQNTTCIQKRKQLVGDGHYVSVKGDRLGFGDNERYIVEKKLGSGTFGTVVAARDLQTNAKVAIKVVRKKEAFLRQAKIEARLLKELRAKAPGLTFDLLDEFEWNGHTCFVFERAQMNLYELIQMSGYKGIGLPAVASIGKQLLAGFERIAQPDLNLVHADLKPENIMLTADTIIACAAAATCTNPSGSGSGGGSSGSSSSGDALVGVRLIDFGSSCHVGENHFKYVQSRFYRAPEVVLELPFDGKIDVWSLGCVLYELYTGDPLFRSKSAAEHVYQIAEVCGEIPAKMLANARRRNLFDAETGKPLDKTVAARAAKRAKGPLAALFISSASAGCEERAFLQVLKHMLAVDPNERLSPHDLLKLPFFNSSGSTAAAAAAAAAAPPATTALSSAPPATATSGMVASATMVCAAPSKLPMHVSAYNPFSG